MDLYLFTDSPCLQFYLMHFIFLITSYLYLDLLPRIVYYFSVLLVISITLLLFLHLRIERPNFPMDYWIIVFNHSLFEAFLLLLFLRMKFSSAQQLFHPVFQSIILWFLSCFGSLLVLHLFWGIVLWFIVPVHILVW